MSIGDDSTIQLAFTKKGITINRPSNNEGRDIESIGSDSNKVDEIGIVDTNRTAKSKDVVKAAADFHTFKTRLAFTKLK